MIAMIRSVTRLAFAAIAITMGLSATPSRAQNFIVQYLSAGGSTTNACTATQPCSSFSNAFNGIFSESDFGRIVCLTPINATSSNDSSIGPSAADTIFEIDCPAGIYLQPFSWASNTANSTATFRNVTFTSSDSGSVFGFSNINFRSSGTLIFENCIFENSTSISLDIEPNGPLNIVIRNSRIANNASGILFKPAAGGSINATLDHVTIANNGGGGLHTDSSNGPIAVDITDSTISENAGNGFNVSSASSGQNNMVSITRSTIAKNGGAGIQSGGGNAAVLLDATLLDSNASGATTVVNNGRILSYGTNRIIGTAGSGFTGTASLK